ncbi:MAG: NF038129 family PEP-CTERM protein [Bryobacterales bacterium]|nr:NF038129 family PEP-CTERM protein [Bryobacterales bacterium]
MKQTVLSLLLLLAGALGTPAATIFDVSIDTSSLSGSGNLNFQVGVLGSPDPVSILLSNLSFDGTLDPSSKDLCFGDSPCPIAGELGTDPTVSFGNDPGNPPVIIDYLQPVTWGSQLSFRLTFAGMAVENPTLPSNGITSFEVVLLDNNFQQLLSTDPALGSILSFIVEDGRVIPSNFSPTGEADVSEIPEPAAAGFVLLGLALAFAKRASATRRI